MNPVGKILRYLPLLFSITSIRGARAVDFEAFSSLTVHKDIRKDFMGGISIIEWAKSGQSSRRNSGFELLKLEKKKS